LAYHGWSCFDIT